MDKFIIFIRKDPFVSRKFWTGKRMQRSLRQELKIKKGEKRLPTEMLRNPNHNNVDHVDSDLDFISPLQRWRLFI